MKTGIAVFAYNRPWHLAKTLSGLKENKEVREIYVFQDGLKREEHQTEWDNTKRIIDEIDWCQVRFFLADRNKGCSRSIRDGIGYVLQENDAVVVIEDDCVPTSNFIRYMLQCLETYQSNHRIYAVNGYSRPIQANRNGYDVYFMPYFFSWGWGTWRDRWEQFDIDNQILQRIKSDKEKSLYFSLWGGDFTEIVFRDQLAGKVDAWDVYWGLKICEEYGVCVTPYDSFIQNTGCDGSGLHCGKTDKYLAVLENMGVKQYELPKDIALSDEICRSMVAMYGGYTGINKDVVKPHVLIYGAGWFFFQNEKYINEHYYIEAFVDMGKSGYQTGKKVIKPSEIRFYQYSGIIIMLKDIVECYKVKEILAKEHKIEERKIFIGLELIK